MVDRIPHEYDEDAICIHCGFDGADWYWQRMLLPKHERAFYPPSPNCTRKDWPTEGKSAAEGETK